MRPDGQLDGFTNIDTAFTAAKAIENEWQRAEALAQLGSQLPENLVIDAVAACQAMHDNWAQGAALVALTPRLAELGYSTEAVQAIAAIRRGYSQAKALQNTMPYLPDTAYGAVIALADAIPQPENRSAAWVGLIPYLVEEQQIEAIQSAQSAIDAIAPGPIQVEAQAELDALVDRLGYQWAGDVDDEPAPQPLVAAEISANAPAKAPVIVPVPPPQLDDVPAEKTVPAHLRYNEAAGLALFWFNQQLVGAGWDTRQLLAHPWTERYLAWAKGKHLGGLKLTWLLPLLFSMACVTGLFLSGLLIGGVIVAGSPRSIETLAVSSDGGSIISQASLAGGETYTIAVSGRFNYNTTQPESWADAQSTYFQQTDSWIPAYWVSIDGQKVIAQQADNSQHLYLFYIEGHNRPVKFRIEERRTTEYGDNEGALVVNIYPGVVTLEELQ